MELNRALPAARIAMKQMSAMRASELLERNAAAGYRYQHIGSYKGRQEPTMPGQGGEKGQMGMTDQIKDKANELKETVKDTAYNLKENIKEKTGLGMDQQGKVYVREYEKVVQGSNQMGAEGNVWDANQHRAKDSTVDRPGFNRGDQRSTMDKVGDVIKGATDKVAEGARKLGLKK